MDSQMYYHLLEWEKDPGEEMAEVSIVPDNWLVMGTDTCRWPPGRISTTLIRKGPTPQLSWPSFPYTRIVRSTCKLKVFLNNNFTLDLSNFSDYNY